MLIPVFDNLEFVDKKDYLLLLLNGTAQLLQDQGKQADADKLVKLFTVEPGQAKSKGMKDFKINLDINRDSDEARQKDPATKNRPRIHIEHVLMVVMQDNGIAVPKGIDHIGDNFKPREKEATTKSPPPSTTQPVGK